MRGNIRIGAALRTPVIAIFVLAIALARWVDAAQTTDAKRLATSAVRTLNTWKADHAKIQRRFLHVIAWTPADREFPKGHHERLTGMLTHIQEFYADEMEKNGFGRRTFKLPMEKKLVVIHEVRGQFPRSHYEKKSGSEIRKECIPVLKAAGINADDETIAIFCNLADWDAQELKFTHNSPYYAGGDYRHGTAWQLDSPELDIRNLTLKTPRIQDGEYGKISLGKHNSIFIGGMAHELGHAFGLPHNAPWPEELPLGQPIMGSGNRAYGEELRGEGRGSYLGFPHALRLASHPLFFNYMEVKQNNPLWKMDELEIKLQDKQVAISGLVKGNPPVYGIVAYFDPVGGDDYNANVCAALPDKEGRFSLTSGTLAKCPAGSVRLIPLHANGATPNGDQLSELKFSYRVSDDGVPHIEATQTRLALAPVIRALASDDRAQATQLANGLQDSLAVEIAKGLLNPPPRQDAPANFQEGESSCSLTRFKPESAKVGWLKPAYDRVPSTSTLLEACGSIYATGLYAHVPSRYEYLVDQKWKRLSGTVGMASGHDGSALFEILGDGQSLWKSAEIDSEKTETFEVSLERVKVLTLITLETSQGSSNAWGLWLEPLLKR